MAGVDIVTVKELLGHRQIEMTLRYSHLAPAHKAKAVDKLADALGAIQTAASEAHQVTNYKHSVPLR